MISIESDGTPKNTRVMYNGRILDSVREVLWNIREDGETDAVVYFNITRVDLESESVIWRGLDEVPDEALITEVIRRGINVTYQ